MKKMRIEKLRLHRETLRTLNPEDLRDAKGGESVVHTNCNCPSISYCFACRTVIDPQCFQ